MIECPLCGCPVSNASQHTEWHHMIAESVMELLRTIEGIPA